PSNCWAELPLIVHPASDTVPPFPTPPSYLAELPLIVQPLSVTTPPSSPATPPPENPAELPLIVQPVSVAAPQTSTPTPVPLVAPPVICRPESVAVTPWSTWKTRLALFPLMITGPWPGPSAIVTGCAVLLSSSWPCDSVIVAAAVPSSISIVLGLVSEFAWA